MLDKRVVYLGENPEDFVEGKASFTNTAKGKCRPSKLRSHPHKKNLNSIIILSSLTRNLSGTC